MEIVDFLKAPERFVKVGAKKLGNCRFDAVGAKFGLDVRKDVCRFWGF